MKNLLFSILLLCLTLTSAFADKTVKHITVNGKKFTIISYTLTCDLGEDYNPNHRYREINLQEIILPDNYNHIYLAKLFSDFGFVRTSEVVKIEYKDINFDGVDEICIYVKSIIASNILGSGASISSDNIICFKQFEYYIEDIFIFSSSFHSEGGSGTITYETKDNTIIAEYTFHDEFDGQDTTSTEVYKFYSTGRTPRYKSIFPKSKKIEILTPTVNALRLRNKPDLKKGTFIRNITKGEKLRVIRHEKKQTIDGITGEWCQVITEDFKIGWCFDGYLEVMEGD